MNKIRFDKKFNSLTYTIEHFIKDLESGVIQKGDGIGYKKIEEQFTKLREDGFLQEHTLTSAGKVRKKIGQSNKQSSQDLTSGG